MKKYAILTSVLALAACGGGSGGGAGSITVPVEIPAINGGTRVTDAARASNEKITSLESEIIVPRENAPQANTSLNTARAASGHFTNDGITYDVYRLDDVDFIDGDVPDNDDPVGIIKLTTNDDGKIVGVNIKNWWGIDNIDTGRDDEKNRFTFNEHGVSGEFSVEMNNGKDIGMRYADFGYLDVNASEDDGELQNEHWVIAGGYDVKNIDPKNITGEMVFAGHAVGNVLSEPTSKESTETPGVLHLDTQDAKLTFNNGTETLNMNFDTWYNVTVTSKDGKSDMRLDKPAGRNIEDTFTFQETDLKNFTEHNHVFDGNSSNPVSGRIQTKYYGDDGNPTEVISVIGIDERKGDKEIKFNAAFGGKR